MQHEISQLLGRYTHLNNSNYKPYHKPDNKILYIHKDSNRPLIILNQIPTSIEKRISTLSSNETIFNESKEVYQKAVEKSGYRQTFKYHPSNENEMLFGLSLHLMLMSKQKSEIIF